MKKKFSLILLISFAISLLLPSISHAVEKPESLNYNSCIENTTDSITPMAAPLIQEVTLRQGESYDFVYPVVYMPEWEDGFVVKVYFKIKAHSDRLQLVSVDLLEENWIGILEPNGAPDYYFVDENTPSPYKYHEARIPYEDGIPYDVRDAGHRITNLSSGTVTYRFGVKILYGLFEDPNFIL